MTIHLWNNLSFVLNDLKGGSMCEYQNTWKHADTCMVFIGQWQISQSQTLFLSRPRALDWLMCKRLLGEKKKKVYAQRCCTQTSEDFLSTWNKSVCFDPKAGRGGKTGEVKKGQCVPRCDYTQGSHWRGVCPLTLGFTSSPALKLNLKHLFGEERIR